MRLEMKTKCYAYASNVDFCTKYKQICINYPKSVYTRDVSMLKKRVC